MLLKLYKEEGEMIYLLLSVVGKPSQFEVVKEFFCQHILSNIQSMHFSISAEKDTFCEFQGAFKCRIIPGLINSKKKK